jgi:adenine specific DNA methylase Mod
MATNCPFCVITSLTESVDLICLDPPFNSQQTYNVLFKHESGQEAEAQIAAFEDTWQWNEAAELILTCA